MPYLCGFWRFANAYSLKALKGEGTKTDNGNVSD